MKTLHTESTDTGKQRGGWSVAELHRMWEAGKLPGEPQLPECERTSWLTPEQLARPDDLIPGEFTDPEAVAALRRPEDWPLQFGHEVRGCHITRRRESKTEYAVVVSDDPNLDRLIVAGWEAD